MNRQQLTQLADSLIGGESIALEHSPTLPPGPEDSNPYGGILTFNKIEGQFELDITIWRNYYHYPATREQPADEGWANDECTFVRSPFLSDLLGELETLGIAPCLP